MHKETIPDKIEHAYKVQFLEKLKKENLDFIEQWWICEGWTAVIDVIRPVAAVPVRCRCPLVGCLAALTGSPR